MTAHDATEPIASREQSLLIQQRALQEEAALVVAELDLSRRLAVVGPAFLTGSYVSGLMVWRELDVMFLVGPELSPPELLAGFMNASVTP